METCLPVTLTKFQMETVVSVLGSIRKGDWMFSIDLIQIPIPSESRPYLLFVVEGQLFQFWALCFGLFTVPQVFTSVFSLILEWVHQRGVRRLWYLDDWLVVAKSLLFLLCHRDLLLQLCQELGIIINWEKSDLEPTSRVQYLVMVIGTSRERVFPSDARVCRFWDLVARFLLLRSPPVKMWQQLLSHMASLGQFVPRGRSRMRPLQWCLKDHWLPISDDPPLVGVHGVGSLMAPGEGGGLQVFLWRFLLPLFF